MPLFFTVYAAPLVVAACETSRLTIVASDPLAANPAVAILDAAGAAVPFAFDAPASSGNNYYYTVGPIAAAAQTGYCTITVTGTRLLSGQTATQAESRVLFLQVDPFDVRVNPASPGRILTGAETTRIAFELTRAAFVTITDTATGATLLGPLPFSSGVHLFEWDGDTHSNETVGIMISAVDLCAGVMDAASTLVFVDGPGAGTPYPILRDFVLSESVTFPASTVTLSYVIQNTVPPAQKTYSTTLQVFDRFGALRDSLTFVSDSGTGAGMTNTHMYDVAALSKDEPYLFQIRSVRTQPPLANGMTNTLAAVTVVLRNDVNRSADTGAPSVVTVLSETTGISVVKASQPSAGAIGLRSNGGFLAGDVYEIEPSGITLATPAVVSFRVTGNQMPEKLGIYRLDTSGTYQPQPSLVDPRTGMLFTALGSFSRYALLVPAYVDVIPPDIRSAEISPRLFSPNGDGRFDQVIVRFDVRDNLVRTFPSAVIEIFNETGTFAGSLLGRGSIFFGENAFSWSGEFDGGRIPPSGRYIASLAVSDIAGNRAEASMGGFTIDIDRPLIEILIDGAGPRHEKYDEIVLRPKAVVTLSATDNIAGVVSLEWKIDAGAIQPWSETFAIGEILDRARGENPKAETHVLTVRATDVVGNVAETILVFRQASNGEPRGERSVQSVEAEHGTLRITSELEWNQFAIGEEIVLRMTYTNPPDIIRPNNPNPTPDGGQTIIRIFDESGSEVKPSRARPAPNPPKITIGAEESFEVAYPLIEKIYPKGLPVGRYTLKIQFRGQAVGEHLFEVISE